MKTCSQCGEVKDESEYYHQGRGGLRADCRECSNIDSVLWRAANKERVAAISVTWRSANKERIAAYRAAWYQANKAKYIDRIRARERKHGRADPDTLLAMKSMRQLPCAYCGGPGGTIDHVIPVSKGGAHHHSNMVPSCGLCNGSKGIKPVGEWLMGRAIQLGRVE